MSDLAALEATSITDIRVLVADSWRRSLVDYVILLNLELFLVHEAQLLVLGLDSLVALCDIFEGVRSLSLSIRHHKDPLLLIRVAAVGQ